MSNSNYGINDMLNNNSGNNTTSSNTNANNTNSQYGINNGTSNPNASQYGVNSGTTNNPNANNSYNQAMQDAVREKAGKDMLYGALWFFGGLVATMADIGAIFWGAMVFGGIQFIGGLIKYNK